MPRSNTIATVYVLISHVDKIYNVIFLTSNSQNPSTRQTIAFCMLGALLAFAPLHTKVAGAAWLGFCIWGLNAAFSNHRTTSRAATSAAAIWLSSCIVALVLASICIFVWSEDKDILNPQMRLLVPAIAAFFLLRKGSLSLQVRNGMFHAIALACIIAFLSTALLAIRGADVRASLATNAIPWAVAISFYPCLLLPAALAEHASILRRWFWLLSAACGIGAILLAQSRGAFLILPWCGLVYAWFWHGKQSRRISFPQTLLMLFAAVSVLLASAWWSPSDVLRMREAAQNIKEIRTTENYNTSIGARIYIWDLAWQGIKQSPWTGIGSIERKRRIEHAGEGGSVEELAKLETVRSVGHVHNQYLNSALDGGMIGLAGLLALLVGMALTIRRLSLVDPGAAWQLGGVLFMHATASLTNVNFLHNYYVMALSLAVIVPLLAAQRQNFAQDM